MAKRYIIFTLLIVATLLNACAYNTENENSNIEEYNNNFVAIDKKYDGISGNTQEMAPIQPNIAADTDLSNYDSTDVTTIIADNLANNQDMTNNDVDIAESDKEYNEKIERADKNKFDVLDTLEWSFVDTELNIDDIVKNKDDEYAEISNYILKQNMQYFNTASNYEISDDVPHLIFSYYTNGRNANYTVYYSYDTPGLYVYAYVD